MDFDRLAPKLQTGDILLFHGSEEISRIIEAATGSPFSHAAMVVRATGRPPGQDLFIWQAVRPTVELAPLDLRQYPGKIEWGTFVCRQLAVDRTPDLLEGLHRFIAATVGTPFARTDLDMGLHWLEGRLGISSGTKDYFCAQLLAETYMHMGLLPIAPPANRYSPKDFSFEHESLDLMRGAKLGDEIVVTLPGMETPAQGPAA